MDSPRERGPSDCTLDLVLFIQSRVSNDVSFSISPHVKPEDIASTARRALCLRTFLVLFVVVVYLEEYLHHCAGV